MVYKATNSKGKKKNKMNKQIKKIIDNVFFFFIMLRLRQNKMIITFKRLKLKSGDVT